MTKPIPLVHWQLPKDADGQPCPHLTATDLLPWARIQLADARYRWTEAQRVGVADTMQRHEVHRWESLVRVLSSAPAVIESATTEWRAYSDAVRVMPPR